jgi:hypothetical protein
VPLLFQRQIGIEHRPIGVIGVCKASSSSSVTGLRRDRLLGSRASRVPGVTIRCSRKWPDRPGSNHPRAVRREPMAAVAIVGWALAEMLARRRFSVTAAIIAATGLGLLAGERHRADCGIVWSAVFAGIGAAIMPGAVRRKAPPGRPGASRTVTMPELAPWPVRRAG